MSSSPAILSYGRPRRRLARVPLLFRARDCEDEDGIFALSYGKRVGLVHTRSGATGLATMADESGRLVRVPSDWPRLSWEMTTAGTRVRTLLGEPPRTNLVLNSGTLDAATWSKSNATASANTDRGVDGALSADRLVEDATAAVSHRAYGDTVTITADGNVCVSRFLKAGTRSWALLGLIGTTESTAARVYFNVATGVKGSVNVAGTGTVVDSGLEAWCDDWYRCWVVSNLGGGITSARLYTGLASGDAGDVYTGDGASYLILGGAQLEDGALVPSSYIPTGATAVTRAADSMYLPYLAVPREMTAYAKGVELGNPSVAGATPSGILSLSDNNLDPRWLLYREAGVVGYSTVHDPASIVSASGAGTSVVRGDGVELRGLLGDDGAVSLGVSVNGAVEQVVGPSGASALGAAWSTAACYLNSTGAANPGSFAFESAVIDFGTQDLDELRELVEVA